jgi:hypothetical protein
MLPSPRFHHIHLKSVDPTTAIDWYRRQFPSTASGEWGGFPALKSPNDVLILFDRVDRPPTSEPQSAIWHFGWHVTDSRATLERYKTRPEIELLPLYTGDGDASVLISSDTWPGQGGVLGLTRPQIAEAKARGTEPTRVGGFSYMRGPDDALVEYAGNHPAERFNHVHMYQDEPLCALLWYQKHLNAPVWSRFTPTIPGEADCKVPRGIDRTWPALDRAGMFRSPRAGVEFGDVSVMWYSNQGERSLVPSRGQLQDHFALAVADLDAWIDKLRGESIKFLEPAYPLGPTRAVMIEGPSREAIELVEIR